MDMSESTFLTLKNNINFPKELIDSGNIRFYPKNSEIIKVGEILDKLFIVIDGKAKVIKYDTNGNEFTLVYFLEGTSIGEGFIFSDIKEVAQFAVVTLEDSKICTIPSITVIEYTMKHPKLLIDFINLLNNKATGVCKQISNLAFNNPINRVAYIMYTLAIYYGNKNNNEIKLPLKFTHQELANITNCTRVTVTRVLNKLSNEGILDIKKDQLIIYDIDRLKDISNL